MKVICIKEREQWGKKMRINIGVIYDVVQMVKNPVPPISEADGVYYELLQLPNMWYHERCFAELSGIDANEFVNKKQEQEV